MKDLIEELQAVDRSVGAGTLPAGEAKVITMSRVYGTDIEDLWNALTTRDRIIRWFLPVEGDLRIGGRYQFEGNAGGEVRICDAPEHLQVTWEMGPPSSEDSSIVDVRLSSVDGGTRLELQHTAVVPPEMWDQFGPGAVGVGWEGALLGMAAHLDGVSMPSPEELETDPAMRQFMTASSVAWGVALAASGVDQATVDRLVAATTAFYVPTEA